MPSAIIQLDFASAYVTNLFITLSINVAVLNVVGLTAGLVPMCIRFDGKRWSRRIGYINCLCGGFLMGTNFRRRKLMRLI